MGFNAEEYAGESNWLKASDLQGHEVPVKITAVEQVSFQRDDGPDERKLAIKFVGREKGMVLNVTNTRKLIDAFGADSDGWIDGDVILYSEQVTYQGKLVNGLRLRIAQPMATEDSDIPF